MKKRDANRKFKSQARKGSEGGGEGGEIKTKIQNLRNDVACGHADVF